MPTFEDVLGPLKDEHMGALIRLTNKLADLPDHRRAAAELDLAEQLEEVCLDAARDAAADLARRGPPVMILAALRAGVPEDAVENWIDVSVRTADDNARR